MALLPSRAILIGTSYTYRIDTSGTCSIDASGANSSGTSVS
jgi:hypothetical protein